jgi:hypothetical protein
MGLLDMAVMKISFQSAGYNAFNESLMTNIKTEEVGGCLPSLRP